MKFSCIFAILAACFYALNAPFSKILLSEIPSTLLAGLLYLGAGIGMGIVYLIRRRIIKNDKEKSLDKKDLKYVVMMILLDIIAPIMLLLSLKSNNSESIALINNFEIVATSLIAYLFFKEKINFKLGLGIILVTIASILLSVNFDNGITFTTSCLFAFLACISWGFENNCTRSISDKDPFQIVVLKGIFSGLGSIVIGLVVGDVITNYIFIIYALILGFIAYGMSVFFYVLAQRYIGASKTSAYYALAPFISVLISFILFNNPISSIFVLAFVIMIIGIVLVTIDDLKK
ncbi:MAG: DMT family transporter [Bacilli bacterium]|nr:DMT family transporter [Bacilli bacterium]